MMQFRAMPKRWNYMYTTYSICSVYRSNIFILRLGNGDGDSCEGHLTAAPNLFWRVHRTRDSLLMCICMCCLSFSHVFILQKTNGHVFFLSPCLLMSLLAACVVGCMKRISRAWYAETEKKIRTINECVCCVGVRRYVFVMPSATVPLFLIFLLWCQLEKLDELIVGQMSRHIKYTQTPLARFVWFTFATNFLWYDTHIGMDAHLQWHWWSRGKNENYIIMEVHVDLMLIYGRDIIIFLFM